MADTNTPDAGKNEKGGDNQAPNFQSVKTYDKDGKLKGKSLTIRVPCYHGSPSGYAGQAHQGINPDHLKVTTEVQKSGVDFFKEGGVHTLDAFMKGADFERARKCPDNTGNAQPPVRSDKKWDTTDWVKLVVDIILLAILFWLLMSQKGCGSNLVSPSVAPVEKPCCLDEYREGIRDGMELSQNRSPVYDDRREEEVDLYDEPDEEEETEVEIRPTTFGQFKAGDPDLTHRILVWFTSQDADNFRFYGSDSLDGENKFVLMAAQMSALITSGKAIRRDSNGDIEVYNTSYTPHNTLHEASRMARISGDNAKYFTSYKNEQSFEWNVNSTLSRSPPSSETDWSQAVKETLRLLMEKVQDEQIPSVNGRVIFAVNHTSKASGASRTARKKSTGSVSSGTKPKSKKFLSPLKMATASYASLGYISPIPAGYRQITGGEFGVWRPEKGRYHYGEDLAPLVKGRKDRTVNPAPVTGTVISAKWEKGYGKCVRLDVGDAVIIFAHLDSFGKGVQKGAKIRQGGTIGNIGRTGGKYGVHLHIEFAPKVSNFIVPIFMKE